MPLDVDRLADEVLRGTTALIAKAMAPLEAQNAELRRVNEELAKRLDGLEARAPRDGKDADPEVIRQMVSQAVAGIPVPKDGKDADPAVIKALVDEAVAALPRPADGKDADPAETARMVADAVAALPVPKDGRDADPEVIRAMVNEAVAAIPPARNGKDADLAEVKLFIADAVAALPAPKDGKDADPEAMAQAVKAEVERAVKALPAPQDGRSVTVDDVRPLVEDTIARAVAALPKAKDGVGVAGAFIERSGNLILTLSDGTARDLGRVDGKDGAPGLGFDDMDLDYDGERGLTFRFVRGERVLEKRFTLPVVLDRGVYVAGKTYELNDGVTYGGSYWIAQEATDERPEVGKGWRLSVKRGRDGRDGIVKADVPPAPIKVG